MSGGPRVVSARLEHQAQQWWSQAELEVRTRLRRIERGESWAPPQMVRCLRAFAGDGGR